MRFASLGAALHGIGGALSADQLLHLELCLLHLRVDAVLLAAEVSVSALEALVVSQFEHCVALQIAIVDVVGVLQTLVLVNPFKLSSFKGFLHNVHLELVYDYSFLCQLRTVWRLNLYLALRAV